MRLIFTIMGTRKVVNKNKLYEVERQLGRKDTILISGTIKTCLEARRILDDLGVDQNRILVDIKRKGTIAFVFEYMNDYADMTFISENKVEEHLIKKIFHGRLEIVRTGRD